MCAPSRPKIPAPTKQEKEAQASARRVLREALQEERRTASQLKAEQTEITLAALAGRRGRISLLSGRRGGKGFELQEEYKTKTLLGA